MTSGSQFIALGVNFLLRKSVLGLWKLILSTESRFSSSVSQIWASGSRFFALGIAFGPLGVEFEHNRSEVYTFES